MSRWLEHFESHVFQTTWNNLKESLKESTVDDKTVITDVKELSRLKKVIKYLDELIMGLDPELIPLIIWDNFNQQSIHCLQQINAFNNNRNIAHLNKANEHVDNLLSYIRPYMVAPGKVGTALRGSIKKYAETIDEYAESFQEKASELVSDINGHKIRSAEILEIIEEVKTTVDDLDSELFGDNEGIESNIKQLVEDIDEKAEKIIAYHEEILVGDEDRLSTKKEISQAKESIIGEQESIEELLSSVSKEVSEINKFHRKVFGKQDKEENVDGGLSGDLDKLILEVKDFEKEQKEKYNALNDEINSLLPGATSAGLATAYRDMKDSFEDPIRNAGRLFFAAIGVLVLVSIFSAIDTIGGDSLIVFVKLQEWDVVLKSIVFKIPFYAPILWLAFYATKRRSEFQRLQQEYAHKEALAKSYNSYKKQIQELDDKDLEMQKEFIMKAIDAIAYNASETLDGKHGDKMPSQDLLEKLLKELAKKESLV